MITKIFYNVFDVVQFDTNSPFKLEGYINQRWVQPRGGEGHHEYFEYSTSIEVGTMLTDALFKIDVADLNLSQEEVLEQGKAFLRTFNHWFFNKLTKTPESSEANIKVVVIEKILDEFFSLHSNFKHLKDSVKYLSE